MDLYKLKYNVREFFKDNAFLTSIFIMAFMYTLRFSMLDNILYMKYVFMCMRLIAYLLVAIKFLFDFYEKKYDGYYLQILITTLFMAFISYKSKTVNYFVYYLYVIIGKDVNYLKIIKSAFYAIMIATTIVLFLYVIGILNDFVADQGGRTRHSLGFKYAAFISNYCFYSTLYYIYIKKDKMKNIMLILFAAINIIVFKFCDTKSAFSLAMLALIITLLVNNVKYFKQYKYWYKNFLVVLPIILPLFIVFISIFYNPEISFLAKFDKILSGRLKLGHSALFTYGVKFFGQYIKFSSTENYNIVDSAFVLYLLILGILFFILMIIVLMYFGKLIDEKKDIYLMYIFIILLLHSTFDAQLLQLSYCYFMFVWSYKNSTNNELGYEV